MKMVWEEWERSHSSNWHSFQMHQTPQDTWVVSCGSD